MIMAWPGVGELPPAPAVYQTVIRIISTYIIVLLTNGAPSPDITKPKSVSLISASVSVSPHSSVDDPKLNIVVPNDGQSTLAALFVDPNDPSASTSFAVTSPVDPPGS